MAKVHWLALVLLQTAIPPDSALLHVQEKVTNMLALNTVRLQLLAVSSFANFDRCVNNRRSRVLVQQHTYDLVFHGPSGFIISMQHALHG